MMSLKKGQATIELVLVFPLLMSIALVVFNGMSYFDASCRFDRAFANAVRTYAVSPGYGQTLSQSIALIKEATLEELKSYSACHIEVQSEQRNTQLLYFEGTLYYQPTLFGTRFAHSFFGVTLPEAQHSHSLTIKQFNPGVLL